MSNEGESINRKAEQSRATRARLVQAARGLFATRGYASVGTEEIVRSAGVTRGALYHQFVDKRDLFRAVFEQVESEVVQRIAERALAHEDPIESLRVGVAAWLEACAEPDVQRVVLRDAPAVLGYDEWRSTGERNSLNLIIAALARAMDAGAIDRQPLPAAAHIIVGALDEAALYVARADDQAAARREMEVVLNRVVDGMSSS